MDSASGLLFFNHLLTPISLTDATLHLWFSVSPTQLLPDIMSLPFFLSHLKCLFCELSWLVLLVLLFHSSTHICTETNENPSNTSPVWYKACFFASLFHKICCEEYLIFTYGHIIQQKNKKKTHFSLSYWWIDSCMISHKWIKGSKLMPACA